MSDDYCTICLNDTDGPFHTLECGHSFHTTCILRWFQDGHRECCNCRAEHTQQRAKYQTPAQRIATARRRKHLSPALRREIERYDRARSAHLASKVSERIFRAEHREVLQTARRLESKTRRDRFSLFCTQSSLVDKLVGHVPYYVEVEEEAEEA